MTCLWNSRSRLTLLAALALGCSPGEPLDVPTTVGPVDIFLGDSTPTLELPPAQVSRSHHLTLSAGSEIAIFVQGLDGALHLQTLVDGIDLGVSADHYAEDPVLLANRTDRFSIAAGKTVNVVVTRVGPETASSLRYRLFVYPVNRDPEHGPPGITLEQVRSEEDLETSADIDEYTLAGHEGKDIVAYLSNVGPGGSGSFSLGFFAENSEQELAGVGAPAVGVPLEDTGTALFTVPAGAHVVRVQGTSNLPSSYTFVIRQGNPAPETPPGGIAW